MYHDPKENSIESQPGSNMSINDFETAMRLPEKKGTDIESQVCGKLRFDRRFDHGRLQAHIRHHRRRDRCHGGHISLSYTSTVTVSANLMLDEMDRVLTFERESDRGVIQRDLCQYILLNSPKSQRTPLMTCPAPHSFSEVSFIQGILREIA